MHDDLQISHFSMLPISRINIKLINKSTESNVLWFIVISIFTFKLCGGKISTLSRTTSVLAPHRNKEKKQKLKIIYIQWNSIRSAICQNSMFCLHRKYTVQSFYVFLGQDLSLCLQPKIFSSYVKNPEIAVNVKS